MSALSVPANFLSPPAKQPAQSNNAQTEAEAPFASVLQQKKVQSSEKGKDAKPSEHSDQSASSNTAQEQASATQAANKNSETPATATIVNGDNAQTALQQLLPWLQSMQGKDDKKDASGTDSLLPQPEAIAPQTPALSALQLDPKEDASKDAKAESAELPAALLKKGAETASVTANLAAHTESLTANDKNKQSQDSFDTALQGANDRLNAQAAQTASTNSSARSEPTRMQAPVGTSQWQNELGDHVHLMSRNNESRAELVLTPPQLGRIEISLNINGDQASALFVSANPEVRAALEGAMDRLREVLANSGIALGQAHVGAESSGQSANGESGGNRHGGNLAAGIADAGAAAAWTRHSNNMLDVFA